MSLKAARPPTNALSLVEEGLSGLEAARGPKLSLLGSGPAPQMQAAAPHPVYDVPVGDIAARKGLGRAQVTGWRYLLTSGSKVVGAAEVTGGRGGAPAEAFAGLNQGPFAAGTAAAIEKVERAKQFATGDYELRVLRVPGLYLMALWLHGAKDDDWIIPIAPAPPGLEAEHFYSASDFTARMAGAASKVRAQAPVPDKR